MSELIQCEFCEIYVDFNEYLYHVRECINSSLQSSIQTSLQSSIIISTTEEENDEFENITDDNNDDDTEDIDDDIEDIDDDDGNIIIRGIQISLNLSSPTNFNFYTPNQYETLSNLQDVKVPVKNIDLVAPLVDSIPEDSFCAICQDLIQNDIKIRKTLCNHYFCSDCLEPWLKELNKTCPSCLTNLEDLTENKK
jgi:hypothetical protein